MSPCGGPASRRARWGPTGDCAAAAIEIEELEVDKDHVHVFLSFPPKYSIGQVVGLLKAVSAREIRAGFPEVRKQ